MTGMHYEPLATVPAMFMPPVPLQLSPGVKVESFIASYEAGVTRSAPLHPPIHTGPNGAYLWPMGNKLGVYEPAEPGGTATLREVYRLTPDGYRIVVDPIEPLEGPT